MPIVHCEKQLKGKDERGLKQHLRAFHLDAFNKVKTLDAKNNQKKEEDQKKPLTKADIIKEKFLRFLIASGSRLDLGDMIEL